MKGKIDFHAIDVIFRNIIHDSSHSSGVRFQELDDVECGFLICEGRKGGLNIGLTIYPYGHFGRLWPEFVDLHVFYLLRISE
jgi:hypothetical protein